MKREHIIPLSKILNLLQRCTKGDSLISAIPLRIRVFNSFHESTRIPRKNVLAIFPNNVSTRFNHEPCVGVWTYRNRLGTVAKYALVPNREASQNDKPSQFIPEVECWYRGNISIGHIEKSLCVRIRQTFNLDSHLDRYSYILHLADKKIIAQVQMGEAAKKNLLQ